MNKGLSFSTVVSSSEEGTSREKKERMKDKERKVTKNE
jgi:hypothetical protein